MTKQENNPNYPQQVADLIERAFQNLGAGLVEDPGSDARECFTLEARLQVAAAQALATLGHAREARVQALSQLAALESVGGEAPDPLIAREAYAQAALMLGLADDPDDLSLEDLRAALAGDADAKLDADLGDLP